MEEFTLITFKYQQGFFSKVQTIPFYGTLAEFVYDRIRLRGPMPVILHSASLTVEEYKKIWEHYIDNRLNSM
jgi:hypothetical protein